MENTNKLKEELVSKTDLINKLHQSKMSYEAETEARLEQKLTVIQQ
jgi:hypothetical protein